MVLVTATDQEGEPKAATHCIFVEPVAELPKGDGGDVNSNLLIQ